MAVSDAVQQSESSSLQQNNKNSENVQQFTQDAAKQTADQTAWSSQPEENNVSRVDTAGTANLYQDSLLPAALSNSSGESPAVLAQSGTDMMLSSASGTPASATDIANSIGANATALPDLAVGIPEGTQPLAPTEIAAQSGQPDNLSELGQTLSDVGSLLQNSSQMFSDLTANGGTPTQQEQQLIQAGLQMDQAALTFASDLTQDISNQLEPPAIPITSPGAPGSPNSPGTPENPTTPTTPDNPTTPTTPDNPTTPTSPDNPTTPTSPDNPTTPTSPDNPTTPTSPDNPTTPTSPDNPTTPTSPDNPTTPTSPDNPTTPPADDQTGLYVQGNQLMDDGKPFVVTGINDTESTEHDELTNSMGQIAVEGANTVRLMGQASDLEGGPNNAFNQEVQSALNAGLKVDISYNTDEAIYGNTGGIMSSSDLAEGEQALQASAAEWGSNPNVMYNVVNEQGASGDATNPQLLSNTEALEQAVVQGAQSTDPSAKPVIVVDDSEWGQGAYDPNYQSQSFIYNNAAALEQAGDGNVVAAIHNYDTDNSYTNAGLEAIQSEGMPVINEEIGYNTSSFNLAAQTSPVTGEPIGGMVWVDGTDPQTGNFYNNVLTDPNTAPAVLNFWNTVDAEAGQATPTSSSG